MGWIIFVVVLLVVLNSISRRAKAQAKARSPREAAQPFPSTQPMSLPAGAQTAPAFQPGNSPTYQPGDSATYRPGDSATYQPGGSATYAPARAVGYQPVAGPPAPQAPAMSTAPSTPDSDYQPPYASLVDAATAWRDQSIIDKDQRNAARQAPEHAPYQGSTAISGSSLATTLGSPYQPSSLMTSLSSSLSSSLTDSPPKPETSAVFGEVSVVALPNEVADLVRFHLRKGHEVEAVRVVCDTMDVGLLEATKTVRSYA